MTLDLFADTALADGRLARPFDHACPVDDSYWLVEQPERHRSEVARAFTDWIRKQ